MNLKSDKFITTLGDHKVAGQNTVLLVAAGHQADTQQHGDQQENCYNLFHGQISFLACMFYCVKTFRSINP